MKKHIFLFLVAVFLFGCPRTAPRAVPSNQCDEYAKTAVSQNEENIREGCGYKGMEWNANYETHFHWCESVTQREADAAIDARDKALSRCKEKRKIRPGQGISNRCEHYAKIAIGQNKENIRRGCGYSGELWHSDYRAHFDYCMRVGLIEAEKQTDRRGKAIERCYPEDRCDTYARVAVWQNKENIRKGCGYRGREWDSNYDNHFQWCRRVSIDKAKAAESARNRALQQCAGPVREGVKETGERCARYAEEAVEQNDENVQRRCGYLGGSWHSDYEAHYRWCLSVSMKKAKSETEARKKRLKKCGSR